MLKIKVLFLFCSILSTSLATLGSDLDEDDFRRLKGTDNDDSGFAELQNHLDEGADVQNDLDEEGRTFYSGGSLWIFE
jgi:hypothetical protein